MRRGSFFLILVAILFCAVSAEAQWQRSGIRISSLSVEQYTPCVVSDGAGGAIVAWYDAHYDIYAQRLDAYGRPLWAPGGVPICTAPSMRQEPRIVSDGAGGAIIVWYDYRAMNYDIYAARVEANGGVLWTADGVPVCAQGATQENHQVVTDGAGGAIITWEDYRNGNLDIYAQRIDASGTAMWVDNGIVICTAANVQAGIQMLARDAGGAFITWSDYRNGAADVYFNLVDQAGWTFGSSGMDLVTGAGNQGGAVLASDGLGGAIVAWMDYATGSSDLYAQKLEPGGFKMWASTGVPICTATDHQVYPKIIPDGAFGAIVAWSDYRTQPYYSDIYAQRVNATGVVQWAADGVGVCVGEWMKELPQFVSDGKGGGVIAWKDSRYGHSDLFAQKIDKYGSVKWSSGAQLCVGGYDEEGPQIVDDGDAGIIAAWKDPSYSTGNIFAQRVERNGYWGYPAPAIADVRDVPGDQGGSIDLAWDASRLDLWDTREISYYTIWRAISHSEALTMAADGAEIVEDLSKIDLASKAPTIRVERVGAMTYYWKLITGVNAYYLDSYSETVPTLFDSTGACAEYHYFQVIAHGEYSDRFWTSAPDSGYSVDNLAPEPPVGLAGEQQYTPEGLELTWRPNDEPDLAGYAIYRGASPGFVPGPGNLVASIPDTLYLDGGWRWDGGYYYKVAAVDIHGNESGYAMLAPDGVTGDETPKTPEAAYLAQNYPNPFNPVTRIAFELKEPGTVSLRIYDAAGRLVRVLVEGVRPAGSYAELWDGRDARGAAVASGIYFYRLTAGSFDRTKKMAILR